MPDGDDHRPGSHRGRSRMDSIGIVTPLIVAIVFVVGFVAINERLNRDDAKAPAAAHLVEPLAVSGHGAPRAGEEESTASSQTAAPEETAELPQGPLQAASAQVTEAKRKQDKKARRAKREAAQQARLAAMGPAKFRLGTFNILAMQHTDRGGQHARWPGWSWRIAQTVGLIRQHKVDVIGLQEVKGPQLDYLTRNLGFKAYPGHELGSRETDNSIIYDPNVWERVSASTYRITFMNGVRHQAILRLRHIATGREAYFLNTHTSAGRDKRHTATRYAGHSTTVSVINRLKADGLPIFLTGDMNDRAPFFCRVVVPTRTITPLGGSTSGGCRPPGRMNAVDWIVATPDAKFSDFILDGSPQRRHISDHYIVSVGVTIGSEDSAGTANGSEDSAGDEPAADQTSE